jgi:hypothetical protein
MSHKASLQMFDGICNLVNDFMSSPDFYVTLKLQCQKSFLCSIKETYCTHRLRPTNRNVRLHDGSSVTVPVFDTKQMIISLLILQKDTTYSQGRLILIILVIQNTEKCMQVMLGYPQGKGIAY